MREWTTPDFRNMPSTTNLEEEEIVDAPGNDGKASMLKQVKRPNPWRKMMMKFQTLKFQTMYWWENTIQQKLNNQVLTRNIVQTNSSVAHFYF